MANDHLSDEKRVQVIFGSTAGTRLAGLVKLTFAALVIGWYPHRARIATHYLVNRGNRRRADEPAQPDPVRPEG